MIELKNIDITLDRVLLRKGHMKIYNGKLTGICGENGCGKTTLLYVLAKLIKTNSNSFLVDGKPLDVHEDAWRRQLSFVMQEPQFLPLKSIYNQFMFISDIYGIMISKEEMKKWLTLLRLPFCLEDNCDTLSGGERQRLGLALALVRRPKLLLLDEPTSALNQEDTETYMKILKAFIQEWNIMAVIVSHKQEVLRQVDFLYEMQDQMLKLVVGKRTVQLQTSKLEVKTKPKKIFMMTYFKRRKKQFSLLLKPVILFLFLVVIFISNFLINQKIKQNNDYLSLYPSNMIRLVNQRNALEDDLTYPPLSNHVLDFLEHMPEVEAIYPYMNFSLSRMKVDEQIIPVDLHVKYQYYSSSWILNDVLVHQLPSSFKQLEIDLGESFQSSQFEIVTDQEKEAILYLPYESFLRNEYSAYAIFVEESQNVLEVQRKIATFYSQGTLSNYSLAADSVQKQSDFLTHVKVVMNLLLGVGAVFFNILFLLHFNRNSQRNWCTLQILGISKFQIMQHATVQYGLMMVLGIILAVPLFLLTDILFYLFFNFGFYLLDILVTLKVVSSFSALKYFR